jgi:hypothetical protein
MIEAPENSPDAPPDSGLNDIAALLAEQIAASHTAARRCFARSEEVENHYSQYEALKIATRLMQASAVAASALKRIRGGEFHQHVTVSHEGKTP